MASMFKESWVHFTSSMRGGKDTQQSFPTDNDEQWDITESWCEVEQERIHRINLKKRHPFSTHYYADLEIHPLHFESLYHIYKSTRRLSSAIQFEIKEKEYASNFEMNVGLASEEQMEIKIKIKLTPIIPLSDLPSYSSETVEMGEQASEGETPSRRKNSRKIKRSKGFQIPGLKRLSEDISSSLDDEMTADVILHCGMMKIHAHRNILCARSSYFSALLLPNSEDHLGHDLSKDSASESVKDVSKTQKDTNASELDTSITFTDASGKSRSVSRPKPNSDGKYEVNLTEVDPTVFRYFLEYLYSGCLKESDFNKLSGLLSAAFHYGDKDLKKKCLKEFKKVELDNETILSMCALWEEYKYEELKEQILHYCTNHPEGVNELPELKECLKEINHEDNKE